MRWREVLSKHLVLCNLFESAMCLLGNWLKKLFDKLTDNKSKSKKNANQCTALVKQLNIVNKY
jgi:hypothetical protein